VLWGLFYYGTAEGGIRKNAKQYFFESSKSSPKSTYAASPAAEAKAVVLLLLKKTQCGYKIRWLFGETPTRGRRKKITQCGYKIR